MFRSIVAAAALVLGAVGCGSSAPSVAPGTTTAPSSPATDLLSVSTEETLPLPSTTVAVTSPETTGAVETTAPSNSVELPAGSGFTDPRDATAEVVGLLGAALPADKRDAVESAFRDALDARLAANGCEVPPSVQVGFDLAKPSATVLVVTATFGCDDSVGGVRYRATLTGSNSKGWTVSSATREDLCLRGEGGALCP